MSVRVDHVWTPGTVVLNALSPSPSPHGDARCRSGLVSRGRGAALGAPTLPFPTPGVSGARVSRPALSPEVPGSWSFTARPTEQGRSHQQEGGGAEQALQMDPRGGFWVSRVLLEAPRSLWSHELPSSCRDAVVTCNPEEFIAEAMELPGFRERLQEYRATAQDDPPAGEQEPGPPPQGRTAQACCVSDEVSASLSQGLPLPGPVR